MKNCAALAEFNQPQSAANAIFASDKVDNKRNPIRGLA